MGQRLIAGFSLLSGQLHQQHEETIGTRLDGFDFLGETVQREGGLTRDTIARASELQVAATTAAADHIARAVVESARQAADSNVRAIALQTDLLLQAIAEQSRQVCEQMADLNHQLRNQAANEANEHFLVGMNFLNRRDFSRALEQFDKARQCYAGHFPTLFVLGFCSYVLGRRGGARDAFQAALSQTADDPTQARRQRAWAALFLGRLAFEERDFGPARGWFEQAYQEEPRLWTALVEAAAGLLLDPSRPDRAANARAVQKVFNRQPAELAYLLWYSLALLLAMLAPDTARDAFRCAAQGDYRARERNRVEVVALLWRLNPRMTEPLLELVTDEFPWLK